MDIVSPVAGGVITRDLTNHLGRAVLFSLLKSEEARGGAAHTLKAFFKLFKQRNVP